MTDYFVDFAGIKLAEYVDDGRDEAVLITDKGSVLKRPFREARDFRKLMSILSKRVPSG